MDTNVAAAGAAGAGAAGAAALPAVCLLNSVVMIVLIGSSLQDIALCLECTRVSDTQPQYEQIRPSACFERTGNVYAPLQCTLHTWQRSISVA